MTTLLRRAVVVISGAMLLLGAAPAAASSSAAPAPAAMFATTTGGELSPSGQDAIADLRVCLASQKILNVYYLVDSSLSLSTADGGSPGSGSDPDFIRASILGNSLAQLQTLGADVRVNWAAGFFSSEYSSAIGWQELTHEGPAALEQAIRDKTPSGYTNWPGALAGAQSSLAGQQSSSPGCQMLVWLTDGQLDIKAPDGQQSEDFDAVNAMCGAELSERGATPQDYGVFNSFRRSGVVVIGALLAVDEASQGAATVMQSLVEGGLPGEAAVCGQQPMPDSFVRGAFVNANGPDALSLVFLQLSARVSGGYPQPFEEDGSFWIDEGVSRFRVIVSGAWSLIPPKESGMSPAASDSPPSWIEYEASGGASVLEVAVDDAAIGKWTLDAANRSTATLFLFSDLKIVFDDVNSVALTDGGVLEASLNATVRRDDGTAADLSGFGDAVFSASYLGPDGNRIALTGASVDAPTGKIDIPLPVDLKLASLDVTASISPLVTRQHALTLAPVTTEKSITLTLPAAFPHIVVDPPITLSDLEGADGVAAGTITVNGPTEGSDGMVCFATPEVGEDAGDRADGWAWTYTGLDDKGCISVPLGGDTQVPVSATNAVAADSLVKASIPVTFSTTDGEPIVQQVPVQFRSTHPVNAAAVLLLTVVLLALGLLIPLLALWILNWLTTRIDVPKNTQRAAFPLTIGPGGTRIAAPERASALSDAFLYSRPTDGERSITDPVLGTLRARVPWFPLRAPWYELVAPAGTVLITARAGRSATGVREGARRLRFSKLPLDRFWAMVVTETELRRTGRGEDVSGTVVIYHRAAPGEEGQHSQRLIEISVDSTLADAVNRARGSLIEQDRQASGRRQESRSSSSSRGGGPGAGPASQERPANRDAPGVGAPPLPGRAGSSAPPPRTGDRAVPSKAGSNAPPPTRGAGAPPPPLGGGSAPPRRPSGPPPPRP